MPFAPGFDDVYTLGIEAACKAAGAVGAVGVHGGQRGGPEDAGRRLYFPEELVGGGELAVVEVLDLDEVKAAGALLGLVGFDCPDGGQAV